MKMGVVADDITGANDIGIMFAKAGLLTHVYAYEKPGDFALVGDPDIVILDTNSRLDLPPVEQLGIDARREIVEARKIALRMALGDQCLHRLLANAFQRAECVAHSQPILAAPDREIGFALVDRGRRHLDPQPPHIVDENRQLVGLVSIERHRRRKKR